MGANRLLQLRLETKGATQKSVAEKLGVSYTAYQNYEYGKRDIPGEVLKLAADLYDTTVDYILGIVSYRGKTIKPTSEETDFVEVPLYGSIAAGTPIEMTETEGKFPIPAKKHEQYPKAFLLKVEGESMNKILPNGCYALIDPCQEVERDNQPYAVCVNGYDATVKRVHKLNNGFELVPDSTDPTYKPAIYDYGIEGTEIITLIGRVVFYVLPYDWEF